MLENDGIISESSVNVRVNRSTRKRAIPESPNENIPEKPCRKKSSNGTNDVQLTEIDNVIIFDDFLPVTSDLDDISEGTYQ